LGAHKGLDYEQQIASPASLFTRVDHPSEAANILFWKVASPKKALVQFVGLWWGLVVDDGRCSGLKFSLEEI
jgi:hypothetical protein